MRSAWNLLMVSTAMAVLVMSAGCSRKTEGELNAATASMPGNADAARPGSSPSAEGKKKPATPADPLHPVVELQTSLGDIVIELDKAAAPITVENFLSYVEDGHYDHTIFHQVLKDYVIMGGGYTKDLVEKKTHPPIKNEANLPESLKNVAGTIAMVRKPDAPDSARCQFFINLADNPNLDYKGPSPEEFGYCPFGRVISGMDVVKKIAEVEVTDETLNVPGKAEKVEFERVPKQAVVVQSARFVR